MLITDKKELRRYAAESRLWQGIPGIEVTKKGRIFSVFYSGKLGEEIGNYVVLAMSEDGEHFTDPVAVAYKEDGYRCYDPCLWMDPLGRLWLIWSIMPEHATFAAVCDDPDGEELHWSEPRRIGNDVMMNKPTVLSTGEWLFPITVWAKGTWAGNLYFDSTDEDRRAFAYKTADNGETFEKLGGTSADKRAFDEHMILELKDGRLAMYVRTTYGIAVSYSHDRGRTWTESVDSGLGGPCSRFFIRRLPSGRILLVNHVDFTGRNNLTAMLSEDEGKTWPYRLLLDGRSNVSYPDGARDAQGYWYITYDRERGFADDLETLYKQAREILYAKITEEDILAGKLVSPGSKLQCIASKLGKYAHEEENPFGEEKRKKN